MKYTGGPWKFHADRLKRNQPILWQVTDENGNFIASVLPVEKYGISGNDKANAVLISASTEMLDACKAALDYIRKNDPSFASEKIMNELTAAINKATGK